MPMPLATHFQVSIRRAIEMFAVLAARALVEHKK